jgi:hypothetical protein
LLWIDYRLRVVLENDNRRVTIWRVPGDVAPNFAEVVWVPGKPIVGGVICNGGAWDTYFAFRTSDGTEAPIGEVLPLLRESIGRRYELTDEVLLDFGNDPIRWACGISVLGKSSDAAERFERLLNESRELPNVAIDEDTGESR